MNISNYKQMQQFRVNHQDCVLVTSLTDDNKSTVTITCKDHEELIVTTIPYRMFCLDIKRCAGYSSCPRSYSCSE
jgi:hypothetical protein